MTSLTIVIWPSVTVILLQLTRKTNWQLKGWRKSWITFRVNHIHQETCLCKTLHLVYLFFNDIIGNEIILLLLRNFPFIILQRLSMAN